MLTNLGRYELAHEIQCDRHRRWRDNLPYFIIKELGNLDIRLSGIKKGHWEPERWFRGNWMNITYSGRINDCRWRGHWYAPQETFDGRDNPDLAEHYAQQYNNPDRNDGFCLDSCSLLTQEIIDAMDKRFIKLAKATPTTEDGTFVTDDNGEISLKEQEDQPVRFTRESFSRIAASPIRCKESMDAFISLCLTINDREEFHAKARRVTERYWRKSLNNQ